MTPEEITALQTKHKELEEKFNASQKEIETLKASKETLPKDDSEDLGDKVKKEKVERNQKDLDSKRLEGALSFTLQSGKFVEEHKSILPSDTAEIFAKAEKEKYDSAIHKSNAIKASLIKSFFDIEANSELLTKTQKATLDEYYKLKLTAKEEKADEIYSNIFEPALNMAKQVEKAKEVAKARNGESYGNEKDAQQVIIKRMTELSKTHYGVKSHAT